MFLVSEDCSDADEQGGFEGIVGENRLLLLGGGGRGESVYYSTYPVKF